MEDGIYRKWFAESTTEIRALASTLHNDSPDISRVAVARENIGDMPFLALYYDDARKIDNHHTEDLVINGVKLAVKMYPRAHPSMKCRLAQDNDEIKSTPEDAARINYIAETHSEQLMNQSNVSCVMGSHAGILIYVLHKGVILNNDTPLPERIEGVNVIVDEGEVLFQ